MSTTDIDNRIENLELLLTKLTEEKPPSMLQRAYQMSKPYILPFIIGAAVGNLFLPSLPAVWTSRSVIERQAAQGGAAIPFPKEEKLPSAFSSPPEELKQGTTPYLLKKNSEPLSPNSRQADDGQSNSAKLFRPLFRRTR